MKYYYKVTAKGYMFDRIHEPHGRFNQVIVDRKLEPCPSWLESIKSPMVMKKEAAKAAGAPMPDDFTKVKSIKEMNIKGKSPKKKVVKKKPRADLEVL